ncbi:RCC1 domain-containing protein, partial [Nocardioides sp.]|uniref:RCC1 domain-containing protein n=1 Tax=Nocardioides sp. TaxID=35761 RepID=UPI0027197445|nr:hypothetical protein [Nocardioides sp.]
GRGGYGQLGDGAAVVRLTPVTVSGLTGATELAAGGLHTCALLGDASVRCWGDDTSGQLGTGSSSAGQANTPVAVVGLSGPVVALDTGTFHTCAVIDDGTVQCWGNNGDRRLGATTTSDRTSTPVTVTGLTDVVDVAAGDRHTCALTGAGAVRCWGRNLDGQLGDGTDQATTSLTTPVAGGAVAVAVGEEHSCALLEDGTVRCWGDNGYGATGSPTTTLTVLTPTAVAGFAGATMLSAGGDNTCATTATALWCWGFNFSGQLGPSSTADRSSTPVRVLGL